MFCVEPPNQVSPPFGLSTVTSGAALSIGTVPAGPAAMASRPFEQSRSLRLLTEMLPGPLGLALVTAIENSVPLPVGPQLEMSASSIVYEPLPLLTTWNEVAPEELRN